MSKEHETVTVRVKCKNHICGCSHTAVILLFGGKTKYVGCPKCGWQTKQKDLHILEIYPSVKIP